MIKKYAIDGITGTWLHQPGMMIYVETEYNEAVNRFINYNYPEICRWCTDHGLIFIYAPSFIFGCGAELVNYMVGNQVWSKFLYSTSIVLQKTLSHSSFSQIQGASLLFSDDSGDSVSSYPIDEENMMGSIARILSDYHQSSVSSLEKELFVEPPVRLRELEEEPDWKNEIRLSIRRDKLMDSRLKFKEQVTGNLCCVSSEIIDDGEKEDDLRFRVASSESKKKASVHHCICLDKIEIDDEDYIDVHLFQEAQKAIAQLLDRGYSKETIMALLMPMQELSPICITRDYRILLPLYNKEIKLAPAPKAIYLLFLKHPEGLYFKNLPDYEAELYHIYRKLAIRGSQEKHIQTVKDLVNPLGNSMNEKCSLIKKNILAILDDSLAKHYYISGEKGELKRIDIKPDMIVWG